jgi:anti-sigma B factor antagonist
VEDDMNITQSKVGAFDVVTLQGEFLTEPEQDSFRGIIRTLVDGGARHVIIDLGEIRHVNSCGLGSMVCALVMMKKCGGDLRFIGVNRDVGQILEITHLNRVFQVYPGLPQATTGQPAYQN